MVGTRGQGLRIISVSTAQLWPRLMRHWSSVWLIFATGMNVPLQLQRKRGGYWGSDPVRHRERVNPFGIAGHKLSVVLCIR